MPNEHQKKTGGNYIYVGIAVKSFMVVFTIPLNMGNAFVRELVLERGKGGMQ